MFNKVLIANRGEIACRVIRTCRRLGIKSVAVYSEADAGAPHVKLADEAHNIGPAPATESYLDMDKIVSVAKSCGAEAIHPGYGFLSENHIFSQKAIEAGLVFIGPPPEVVSVLGSKDKARQFLAPLGVPFIPWAHIPIDNSAEALQVARRLGFPIVVKPSNAGGGKGTTVVWSEGQLEEAVRFAAGVAMRSFGTAAVHLEKYLQNVRHIEIQIVADQHGNFVHLGERDCSWQRRHQKVVEEAPSLAISQVLRRRIADTALKVVKAGHYVNAGTVEFLVDHQNNFYFLEVNCRIQVEHPVTEMITGIDMVELQMRIAAGQKLPITQETVHANGHAIEARVYAEDPESFLPQIGAITKYREPAGPGVRIDSGVCQDYEVSVYYDPMLAKLITWGQTRERALLTMAAALQDFTIEGVTTNIPLLLKIVSSAAFETGEYHTGTLTTEFAQQPIHSKPGMGLGLAEYWRYGL